MKLNYDCIRTLLIVLEENLEYNNSLAMPSLMLANLLDIDEIKTYSKEDIVYSSKMLIEAGYIEARIIGSDTIIGSIVYYDVTFEGHKYIDSIRDNKVWNKVKDKIKGQTSSITFDIIAEVAKAVILGFIGLK